MVTTTESVRHSARTGRTISALIAGTIFIAMAYQTTETHDGEIPNPQSATAAQATTAPATDSLRGLPGPIPVAPVNLSATTAVADPFQIMADLTPVVSTYLEVSTATGDPLQVTRDLTPVLSVYFRSADS